MKKYQVIYADPPWSISNFLQRKESRPNQGDLKYQKMTMEQIVGLPVNQISQENCCLFIWATQKFLPQVFNVVDKWGFKYHLTLTWDKMNGLCLCGFHRRTEFLIFAYKGKLPVFPKKKTIPSLLQYSSKKLRHSQKPDEIRNLVGTFGETRIELFARQKTEGWDVWGNEIESTASLPNPKEEEVNKFIKILKKL